MLAFAAAIILAALNPAEGEEIKKNSLEIETSELVFDDEDLEGSEEVLVLDDSFLDEIDSETAELEE